MKTSEEGQRNVIYKIYVKGRMVSAMTTNMVARYGKDSAAARSRINARNIETCVNNLLNFK